MPYDKAYEEGYEDMPRRVPDISRIRALIGFEPTMNLDQIIESVVASTRGAGAAPAPSAKPRARARRAVRVA
jgi:UDP-glucose 4-epimerase